MPLSPYVLALRPVRPDVTVEQRIREYYDALAAGRSLEPFLGERAFVKIGVEEMLTGADRIAEGLHEQRRTTSDWRVESQSLRTDVREGYALFSDQVSLAWTEDPSGDRHEFETRWSGTLVRTESGWAFVSIHVSVSHEL